MIGKKQNEIVNFFHFIRYVFFLVCSVSFSVFRGVTVRIMKTF